MGASIQGDLEPARLLKATLTASLRSANDRAIGRSLIQYADWLSAQADEIDEMCRSLAAAHDAGKHVIVAKIEALHAALSDRAEPEILREISATEQRIEAALAMAAFCLPQD